MKRVMFMAIMGYCLAGLAWAGPVTGIIPEMQECMQSHSTPAEYEAVLKKYSDPGLIRRAMGLLVIKKPYVVKTEQKGEMVCYTVEGTTVETSYELPADTTQTYNVCWKNRRIVSLEFYDAKPQVHQEVIPEMRECLRSHRMPAEYEAVLKKYSDPGIIRKAMALLVIKAPYVVKTEKKGPVITYTVEGRTVETSSEIPPDTVQRYTVSWKNGRIVALNFLGPKKPAR
ncbi:MAG: hypothetical protein A4E68_01165 [Syntrophaceae bacterium PtaB.Bin095]|nr:MAG: hypothetical protein A4E68_01165 [Syntrophaceae bacterium PtaB.Bin095]